MVYGVRSPLISGTDGETPCVRVKLLYGYRQDFEFEEYCVKIFNLMVTSKVCKKRVDMKPKSLVCRPSLCILNVKQDDNLFMVFFSMNLRVRLIVAKIGRI